MMTLGHVQSAQGQGWEVAVGGTTYWFGRGLGGALLGAFSSVVDLLDAFDRDNERAGPTKFRFDLTADKTMTAHAELVEPDDQWVVYRLTINGNTVGFCVDTPKGALQTIYADLESASSAVR
jgi:hypothetical protein